MQKLMEKVAILSLSLILVSTYSVSCILPKLMEHFQGYPRERVELLISIPSFGIACMVLLNIWLTRILSERISIILGAAMIILAAVGTIFFKSYGIFLGCRVLLGFGIGMINARAVTIVQDHYEGKELATLLGIRGSMEVLGNTLLTFLAGRLMLLGWDKAFGVYLCILPILILYLLFVKTEQGKTEQGRENESPAPVETRGLSRVSQKSEDLPVIFLITVFLLGWVFINTNVSATMRMASLMLERRLGNESNASLVLSFMLIAGVLAGILFEHLLRIFHRGIIVFGLAGMGLGLIIISQANSLFILYLGAFFSGFANGILPTILFHDIAVRMSKTHMATATSVALLGCNLGASSSPLVLKCIDGFRADMPFSYMVYGGLCLSLAVLCLGKNMMSRRMTSIRS